MWSARIEQTCAQAHDSGAQCLWRKDTPITRGSADHHDHWVIFAVVVVLKDVKGHNLLAVQLAIVNQVPRVGRETR